MKINRILQILTLSATTFAIVVSIPTSSHAETNTSAPNQPTSKPEDQPPCPQRPPRQDFKGAAKQLGVTEAKLVEALGLPPKPPEMKKEGRPPRLDIRGAAQKLGVTEQQLIKALGIPPHPPGTSPENKSPSNKPNP